MKYYSAMDKNKILFSFCKKMDGLWGNCAKWDKSDRERQILYDISYMWNLKKKEKKIKLIKPDSKMRCLKVYICN